MTERFYGAKTLNGSEYPYREIRELRVILLNTTRKYVLYCWLEVREQDCGRSLEINIPSSFRQRLNASQTMLQQTALRLDSFNVSNYLALCGEEHRFIVAEQLRAIGKLGPLFSSRRGATPRQRTP